uniref:Zinc knuckle CX2CX4HX4C n=1 Tax=Tanacetum cinerariifolium TaxID=118510 RepID=A0A6L2LGW2_TANCI|nr:hypothetical protein [Tanacetum cinerariifolium]
MCLKSWGRGSYARILIEIDACNGFSNNLVMAVPNTDGPKYTKDTIRVEYVREPPRYSTCLIFGHSVDDCPNAPKRVVNRVDKDKGGSSGVDGDGFIKVKRKKSVNQPTKDVSPKMTPSAGKKKVSRKDNSLKKTCKTNSLTSGNRTFSVSNSFDVLNVDNPGTEQVDSGNKASMSGVQEEGQNYTPLIEMINMFEQQLLEWKCVLVDGEGKPLENDDYTGDHDSEDEVEHVDNEMESYLDSEPSGDPHDDDMYEGNEIPENIQSICDNLDIKVILDEESPGALRISTWTILG